MSTSATRFGKTTGSLRGRGGKRKKKTFQHEVRELVPYETYETPKTKEGGGEQHLWHFGAVVPDPPGLRAHDAAPGPDPVLEHLVQQELRHLGRLAAPSLARDHRHLGGTGR